jgi:Na+/melibiose symporter-like transporter
MGSLLEQKRQEPPRLTAARGFGYSLGNLGTQACSSFASAALPLYLGAYGLQNWAIGLLAQERSVLGVFVQPITGLISDRLPVTRLGRRRPFLLAGIAGIGPALLLLALHPPLWAVILLVTLFSLTYSVCYDPYQALLMDIAPVDQRASVSGLQQLLATTGQLLIGVLFFALWTNHQAAAFGACFGLMAVTFLAAFLAAREPASLSPRPAALPRLSSYRADILGQPALARLLLSTALFYLGMGGVTPFLTRFGVEVLHAPENVAFLLLVPAATGIATAAFIVNRLGPRLDQPRVMTWSLLALAILMSSCASIVRTFPQGVAATFIIGISCGFTYSLMYPFLTRLIPSSRAAEFTGIGNSVWSLTQPLGALISGGLADSTGTLRGSFAGAGIALFAAFLVMRTVKTPDDALT